MDWQAYAQGEYVGHARLAHVPEYRLRVDDQLDMTYRLTREETSTPYRLNVGDEIQVESFTDHDDQPQPADPARRHDHAAAAGPGPRHRPHGDPTPRRAGRGVQEVLQDSRHHRHAAEGQHEAGRPAGDDRPPGGHRRPEPGRPRHARGHHRPAGHRLGPGPRTDPDRTANGTQRVLPAGRRGDPGDSDPGAAGAALRLRAGRGEQPRPLRVDRPDHGLAGHQHGRQLARRREPAADRRLPPRRRLAAAGHA